MIPRKATAFLFLFFSIAVAFYNYLIGRYEHTFLTIPFIVACLSHDKISRISELIGVALSATYLIVFGELYIGIMGMIVATCMFFAMGYSLRKARVYVCITTLIVGISAYYQAYDEGRRIVISLLNSGIYFVCSACIYIAFQSHIDRFNKVIDEAHDLAKDVIDHIKGQSDGQ
ncbi:MAG: hypothetical protein WC477_06280 [Patescibacteria group bacterium]